MAKAQPVAEQQRYVLYFRGHRPPDEHRRIWVPIYWDPGQARFMIEKFIGSSPFTREGNVLTITDTTFTITCEQLDAVLDADPVAVRDEDARVALRFRMGTWDEDHSKPVTEIETVTESGEVVIEKVKKPPKEAKPKKAGVPDGYVKIGTWCEKWKIKPLHARTCLRASDLEKPEYGWAFPAKDEKKIAKLCGVKL